MGLFGDFFRAVGRTVGRVVETVGDAIGSTTISDLGWKIQDACAERVASEKSYDKKEANIYTTEFRRISSPGFISEGAARCAERIFFVMFIPM